MDEDFVLDDLDVQYIEEVEEKQAGEDNREEQAEREEDPVSRDEDDDDSEKLFGWGSLPDICLRLIFWWLPNRDRASADQVCRHWHTVMRLPSLWRFHRFILCGHSIKSRISELRSTLIYTHYLGAYLKRLELVVRPPARNSMAMQLLQHTMIKLFDGLIRVRAQLESVSLVGLRLDRRCWTRDRRSTLMYHLSCVFQSARWLTSVNLEGMRNTQSQGLQLLFTLSISQRHRPGHSGISSLNLEGFFSSALRIHRNHWLPHILQSMQGLVSLQLSYSCVSDQLLLGLGHTAMDQVEGLARGHDPRRGACALRRLTLKCIADEPHEQVVRGSSWASLALRCPDLHMKISVVQVVETNQLAKMLLPEIPLTEYHMNASYRYRVGVSAKPLLSDMLPQYRHSLQRLSLDLFNFHELLDEELLDLVQVCVCLQQLEVSAFLGIRTLERLLQYRLDTRSSLNHISVSIYYVTGAEDTVGHLQEMLSRYQHLPPELNFVATVQPISQGGVAL